jgi:choline dehydrogenase-like flavoprotein
MSDAEIIVIGSGPAGVSAAWPLVEAGRKVLMLDGAGVDDRIAHGPARVLGPELEGLSVEDGLSPKLRAPEARLALAGFQRAHGVEADNFLPVGSLARGGLSRVWGGFAAEFDAADLKDWPIGQSDLAPSYRRVTERIGVSGTTEDAAGRKLSASGPLQPPLPLGAASQLLLNAYRGDGPLLLGQARNALISRPLDSRSPCDLRGGCLWGCPLGAIYDARSDLARLAPRANFRLAEKAEVIRLEKQEAGWRVSTADGRSFVAGKVVLAAGTLGSTRLVAPLLPVLPGWRLLSNPVVAAPLLMPRALMTAPKASHDLAQLAFFLPFGAADDYVSGAIYETVGLPASSFASQLPLGRRAGEAVFRFLSSALLVAVSYFAGAFSRNLVEFERATGKLKIKGGFAPGFADLVREIGRDLARHWRRSGAVPLARAQLALPGTDAHFAGTLPMGGAEANGTNTLGELKGLEGLHMVDGAVLPSLPSKHATLTIMANADRIGLALSQR